MKRTAIRALVSLLGPLRLIAQADSAAVGSLFTYRDLLLAGTFAVATYVVRPLDNRAADALQDSSTQDSRNLHRIAQFVRTTAAPGSYIIGASLYAIGRLSKEEHLASLGLHGAEALLVGEAVGGIIKGIAGRQRPYVTPRDPLSYQLMRGFANGDQYRSFPSGHTVAAFAAAAAVTGETAAWRPALVWVVGPLMYGGAAAVGASRMFDNRHWASDVIVGAGIGTFAGLKVVRYHAAHPDNKVDRFFLTASIIPSGEGHVLRWSVAPVPSWMQRSH